MNIQIRLIQVSDSEFKIFIKQNNFLSGILNVEKRIFYCVPRTSKNQFHLFGGGLGLNVEILHLETFDKIMLRYNSEILTTYRLKWIEKGIVCPYGDHRVDSQIILPLSEINLDWEPEKIPDLTLFNEVI